MTPGRRRTASLRDRWRLGLLGLGVAAAMSLVWQQHATLASFIDTESAGATFRAATLEPITPTAKAKASSVELSWAKADGDWAPPLYSLAWSASKSGSNPVDISSGSETGATHRIGSDRPTAHDLTFTKVAVGSTHACGIANGTVYCWGTSSSGALGLGGTTQARVPTAVTGGDLGSKAVTDVTAGDDFTCAVAVSGKAYCWGRGTNGQLGSGSQSSSSTPRTVATLSAVTSISAGAAHACAVAAGKAYCWGQGSSGQLGNGGSSQKESPEAVRTDGVLAGRTVASVAAGGAHSCVVADGRAFCWGANGSGQLGSATASASTPTAVDASGVLMGRVVSQVTAGASHTCAVADGKAYCWGQGTSGQLGNSASANASAPVAVSTSGMSGTVVALSTGSATTCAVASGNAYCWGAGATYGLGNGGTSNASAPVAVNGALSGRTVTGVSAGPGFGCAVAAGSPASCWGAGSSYQLGDNAASSNQSPGDVSLTGASCPDGSVRLSDATCSLLQGTDYYYRLGYSIGTWTAPDSAWKKATTSTRPGVEASVASRTGTAITLGWDAAQEPGQAYAEYTVQRSASSSGANPSTLGVTGDRSLTDTGGLAPTRSFTAVSSGEGHTCGIVDGQLYCWGLNSNGQLGLGDTNPRTVPTLVPALAGKTVSTVSAGTAHTCAVADSKVYCWGQGTSGQLGNGANNTQYSPVLVSALSGAPTGLSAGGAHTCAIVGGAAYCWGSNSDGQLGNNSTASTNTPVAVSTSGEMGSRTVTAIAAGGAHSCAVADGKAYCWGQDASYQLGSRSCTLLNVWCLLGNGQNASRSTSVAVDTDGAMGTKSVVAITAGTSHSCAIAAGAAYCWGLGSSGQLGNGATSTSYLSRAVTTSTMTASVTALSARADSTCAIAGGAAYCWGQGTAGQLGNGGGTSSSPVAVTASGALKAARVTSVSSGTSHSCVVADGLAYCWGAGDNGRLGTRSTAASGYPVLTSTDALCDGSSPLGDGTCSLKSGTTYYYRVTFTLDGTTRTRGDWVGIKTSG
ncbi:MAG: hypothetical protein J0I14_18210 [Propionibacteriaceae bacterium]|nr:hypothetical protein [Propionibacteriaceae bacterium]